MKRKHWADTCEDGYAGMPNKVGCDNCVKLRKQFAEREQKLGKGEKTLIDNIVEQISDQIADDHKKIFDIIDPDGELMT